MAEKIMVKKPWGHEEIWAKTDKYVGKSLFIKAGHSLSLQYHERKEETIMVDAGHMILRTRDSNGQENRLDMYSGDTFHIPTGLIHQMIGVTDCIVQEVSTPELDDVIRLEDQYGRAGTSAH